MRGLIDFSDIKSVAAYVWYETCRSDWWKW